MFKLQPTIALALVWALLLIGWTFYFHNEHDRLTIGLVPTAHDLGTMRQYERRDLAFRLVNQGRVPVLVERVQATCGCTTARDFVPTRVDPGNSLKVAFQFDSRNGDGRMSSFLLLLCRQLLENDVASQSLMVRGQVVATVQPDFRVEPPILDFGEVRPGPAKTMSFVLKPVAAKDAVLVSIQALPTTLFSVGQVSCGPIAPDGMSVPICLSAQPHARMRIHGTVQLAITGARRSPLLLPVTALYVPEIQVTPECIAVGADISSSTYTVAVQAATPFALSPAASYSGVTITTSDHESRSHIVIYAIDRSLCNTKHLDTVLSVKFSDGSETMLVVPVVTLE